MEKKHLAFYKRQLTSNRDAIERQVEEMAKRLEETAAEIRRTIKQDESGLRTLESKVTEIINTVTWLYPNLRLGDLCVKLAEFQENSGVIQAHEETTTV